MRSKAKREGKDEKNGARTGGTGLLGRTLLLKHPRLIPRRVGQAGLGKTLQSQLAGVAAAAGGARGVGVIATMGEAVIDAQLPAAADDLGLGPLDQAAYGR